MLGQTARYNFMKLHYRLALGLSLSFFIYLVIALALVYFPQPDHQARKNFDFSSLPESTAKQSLGLESSMPMRDGTRVFFREYASQANTTLILLHGSGSESRYLSQLANYLAEQGVARVITPDLRGHGRTSIKKGDISYLGQYDDDLEDMLAYVRVHYPQSRLVLGGHSSGGGLVLRYAGQSHKVNADAYLFLAPYLSHESPTVKPDSGGWVSVNIKRIVGISMLENLGLHSFESLDVIHFNLPAALRDPLQTSDYSFRLLMSLNTKDYREDIRHLNRPALVVVGEQDETFYPELFKAEFATAKTPIQVDLIAGANHLDFLENQRTEQLLSHWLMAGGSRPTNSTQQLVTN